MTKKLYRTANRHVRWPYKNRQNMLRVESYPLYRKIRVKVDLPNQSKVQQQLLLLLQAHNSLIDIAIFRFEGLSLYELFDRHFHISSEQMEILTKDGKSKCKHRIRSAKWRLRQLGLVSSRSKGIWELTAGGLAASMLLGGSVIEKHLEGKLVSRVMRSYERSAYASHGRD